MYIGKSIPPEKFYNVRGWYYHIKHTIQRAILILKLTNNGLVCISQLPASNKSGEDNSV